jgi:hypothetical protein
LANASILGYLRLIFGKDGFSAIGFYYGQISAPVKLKKISGQEQRDALAFFRNARQPIRVCA